MKIQPTRLQSYGSLWHHAYPFPGAFCPTVIDKGWSIESIGSRRTFDSGVRARCNSRRTSLGEGIRTQEMSYDPFHRDHFRQSRRFIYFNNNDQLEPPNFGGNRFASYNDIDPKSTNPEHRNKRTDHHYFLLPKTIEGLTLKTKVWSEVYLKLQHKSATESS